MATRRFKKNDAAKQDLFTEKVESYPDEYLGCRDRGHHWQPKTAKQGSDGNIFRVLVCEACSAERNQKIDKYGYIISSNYSYSTGYVIPGTGRLSAAHRAVLRITAIFREIK